MSWLLLVLAGFAEVAWAVGLKYTAGFTKPVPSVLTLTAMVLSVYLLSLSLRSLPLGTAYAVWVGIGAIGTAIAGIFLFEEAATPLKLISLTFVVAGIVGLKLASDA